MKQFPKISIITPVFNQVKYIRQTIESVLSQDYSNVEYIIIDGGSTDGTLEIIKEYEHQLAYFVSEKDEGQYFALQKGFKKSTGKIMCWINGDDILLPNALKTVSQIFSEFNEVNWLMGFPMDMNLHGSLINRYTLPYARWSKYRFYNHDYKFIQQESCFWRRDLWNKTGESINTEYNLAADFELWSRFFLKEKLYTTTSSLAAFRHSKNQRSKVYNNTYLSECESIIKEKRQSFSIDYSLRKWLSLPFLPSYHLSIPLFRKIYPKIMELPPVISYNLETDQFEFNQKHNQTNYPTLDWLFK